MTNEAIRLGADDFMLKPKDIPQLRLIADELVATIRHLTTDMPPPAGTDACNPAQRRER